MPDFWTRSCRRRVEYSAGDHLPPVLPDRPRRGDLRRALDPDHHPQPLSRLRLAESVRLRESPAVAPARVGYLPANLVLSSVHQIMEKAVTTFDDRFGNSYRDLMFVGRSAGRAQIFTLDVGVLVAPQKPLDLKNLPDARTVPSGT